MYRNGCSYNKMAKLVIDVYLDYNICGFPVDEHDVCRKIGIKLVPYSKFQYNNREILNKKSKSGFYVPPTRHTPPIIFYNDSIEETESIGNIRRNIFHEVKHYICGDLDENPDDDDLADYFGKYFLAPIPYLICKNITDANQIMSNFGVDFTMASYILKNIRNRKKKYGDKIFNYEIPLLKHLLGCEFDNT